MTDGRLFGIRVRIHLLFWAVVGLSVAAGYFIETLTLFLIVFVHELGHVAVAREVGWRVTEIQLLPFGGVAKVEDEAACDPLDEMVVALAGPFMNVAMIFVSLLFWRFGVWTTEWTRFFVDSNLMIAGFNLLPIWPLDGGRIVQALLCFRLPYRQAALASLGASSLLAALLLGCAAYSLHLNLMAVATYLAILNVQAFQRFPYLFIRFLMGKHTGEPAAPRLRTVPLEPTTTVMQACQQLRKGCYHLFSVRGHPGWLSERQVLHALLVERKHDAAIGQLL